MTVQEQTFELAIGELVDDRYKTDAELGRGGMGRVYLAHQRPFDRQVVIKTMHPKFVSDEEHRKRFFNEARAASQLSHPNTITVFDFGKTDRDVYFIAMEYIDGISLREALSDAGRLPLERAVPIVVQVAQSLGEAHRKGIIHRDLKPANIMLGRPGTSDEFVKVLDFGIAKLVDDKSSTDQETKVYGTPGYMSPEQSRGEDVDQTSDLYSLSCCFYEMLSGQMPFEGDTQEETIIKQQSEPVPPLPESVPQAIRDFVRAGLARDPGDRPPSADDYVAALLGSLRDSRGKVAAEVAGESPSGGQRLQSTPTPTEASQETLVQTAASVPTPAGVRESATTAANDVPVNDSHPGKSTSGSTGAVHSTPEASKPISSGIHEFSGPDDESTVSEPRESTTIPPGPDTRDASGPGAQKEESSRKPTRNWAIAATVVSCLLALAVVVLSLDDVGGDREADSAGPAPSASLVFESKPSGAIVVVDGREVGLTPTRYSAAAPGDILIVEMSASGFAPERITHEVADTTQDQRVFAALERREIELSVTSPIPGAELTINDRPHGALPADNQTNIKLMWPREELVIRMNHPDYEEYIVRIPSSSLEEQMRVDPTASDFVARIEER